MATVRKLRPDDPADPDVWPCWHADGWEQAGECSMLDATDTTRAQARAAAAHDDIGWTEAGVWKRYIRLLTRQEVWTNTMGNSPVPEDWRPSEYDPLWTFCHRSDPEARPYWVIGLLADGPPPNPVADDGGTD